MELDVRVTQGLGPGERPVEVVERKGVGHPDTMCDGIAERVCAALCRHYLDRFGAILHHNVDKVLLVGGASRPAFGGGEVHEPIEIYLAGRATTEWQGARIDAAEIAAEACRGWLREHVRHLDVERHVRIVPRLRPGASELCALVGRVRANDTSCGVGFAPPTDLERAVLAVESDLNAPLTKLLHPEIGEDVKVMGVRHKAEIALTVACALVDRHLGGVADYERAKARVAELARSAARNTVAMDVRVTVNAGDDVERGNLYLTATGTSAEAGDDGETGRGNRVGGLITPCRPMTLEAACGKNPVSHVGKLYNVLGRRIAEAVAGEVDGVADASCLLVSRIGGDVADPQLAHVEALTSRPPAPGARRAIEDIVRRELGHLDALREQLLAERVPLF